VAVDCCEIESGQPSPRPQPQPNKDPTTGVSLHAQADRQPAFINTAVFASANSQNAEWKSQRAFEIREQKRKAKRARAKKTRSERHDLRDCVAKITGNRRVEGCGRYASAGGGGVSLLRGEHGAHFSGLQTCGSVWLCPVCAAKIRTRRAQEVKTAALNHIKSGKGLYTQLLTLPHAEFDDLKVLWDTLRSAWRSATGGRAWQAEKERYGIMGQIRAAELTYGKNGFHPHLHILWFCDRQVDQEELESWGRAFFERFSRRMVKLGHGAPLAKLGGIAPVRSARQIAEYLSKVESDNVEAMKEWRSKSSGNAMRIGLEVTRQDTKGEHSKGKSMWEVALIASGAVPSYHDAIEGETPEQTVERNQKRYYGIWQDYERGVHRQRALTWSRDLRDLLGLGEEEDDESVAAQEVGGGIVMTFTPIEWAEIRQIPQLRVRLLEAVEEADVGRLRDLLRKVNPFCSVNEAALHPKPPDK
jgi:hypothetical protein